MKGNNLHDEYPSCATNSNHLQQQSLCFCQCGYRACTTYSEGSQECYKLCPKCKSTLEPTLVAESNGAASNSLKTTTIRKKLKKPYPFQLSPNKNLLSIRVVQRNLVYVTNLPLNLADEELLMRHEYFGQYGKIIKMSVNRSYVYQGSSVSCYVTYFSPDEASLCIECINGCTLNNKTLRASFGTTKYCTYFLKGRSCVNADCMYLHTYGDECDSFTKEEMLAQKHLERYLPPKPLIETDPEYVKATRIGLPPPKLSITFPPQISIDLDFQPTGGDDTQPPGLNITQTLTECQTPVQHTADQFDSDVKFDLNKNDSTVHPAQISTPPGFECAEKDVSSNCEKQPSVCNSEKFLDDDTYDAYKIQITPADHNQHWIIKSLSSSFNQDSDETYSWTFDSSCYNDSILDDIYWNNDEDGKCSDKNYQFLSTQKYEESSKCDKNLDTQKSSSSANNLNYKLFEFSSDTTNNVECYQQKSDCESPICNTNIDHVDLEHMSCSEINELSKNSNYNYFDFYEPVDTLSLINLLPPIGLVLNDYFDKEFNSNFDKKNGTTRYMQSHEHPSKHSSATPLNFLPP